jgi:hypothetical protein
MAILLTHGKDRTSTRQGDRLVFVNAGLIHGVRKIIVYANLGHSIFADDGLGHTYAGFGLKVLIDPTK